MADIRSLTRIVDSSFAIPDLMDTVTELVDGAYQECEDYHPSGIEVEVRIRPRGKPRPRW